MKLSSVFEGPLLFERNPRAPLGDGNLSGEYE